MRFVEIYLHSKYVECYCREENNCSSYWSRNISLPFRYSDIYDRNVKFVNHKWLNLLLINLNILLKDLTDTDGVKVISI